MSDFASAVGAAVEQFGPPSLRVLADGVEAGRSEAALTATRPVPGHAEAVAAIRAAQRSEAVSDALAIAYLRGVADGYQRRDGAEQVESVWSGPSTHAVPVRATAQALVQLIEQARQDLLLMTYSARPHAPVVDALCAARARGVRVRVVVETLQGAGGALAGVEPAAAFLEVPEVQLWHWPVAKRCDPRSRMHAKIAVADRAVLLVSSANLTQSGTEANLEAGLLVRGGNAPRRAVDHIEQLIAADQLERLSVGAG